MVVYASATVVVDVYKNDVDDDAGIDNGGNDVVVKNNYGHSHHICHTMSVQYTSILWNKQKKT